MKARELGRGSIVVGDRVSLIGDVSGGHDTLARVVRVQPRTSALRRSADDTDPVERVIVANADQLMIVCALADPPPRPRLIDRFLVAAYDAGLEPLLCLTKSDLAGPEEILAAYDPLGVAPSGAGPAADRRAAGRASRAGHRPGQRAGRPVGGGQVNAVQCAGPGGRPGHRGGQRGHRARPAHLLLGAGPAAAERRLDSSTRRGCAASGSGTSPPPTCSGPSPTWPRARRRASQGAATWRKAADSTQWAAEHGADGPAGLAAAAAAQPGGPGARRRRRAGGPRPGPRPGRRGHAEPGPAWPRRPERRYRFAR